MALDITATKTSNTGGAATTDFTVELPSAYAVGNKLFIAAYLGGTGAVTTPSGWTSEVSIVSSTFTRLVVFSKTAVANEPDPVITTAAAITSAAIAFVVSGQDAATYLDVAIQTNTHGGVAVSTMTWPAITPVSNNTLIIDIGGSSVTTLTDCAQGKQRTVVSADRYVTALWYGNRTAGIVESTSEAIASAGRCLTARIAIRGASGLGCPAIQANGIGEIVRCTVTDPLPAPADITARRATFNGVATTALTSVTRTSNTATIVSGTSNAVVTMTPTATANLYVGWYSTFTTVKDFSGLVTFNYAANFTTTIADQTTTGFYFEDNSGNWALKRVPLRTSNTTPTPYWVVLDDLTSIDSSGAINWADIKYFGFAYRKLGTGVAARTLALAGLAKNAPLTLTGDCNPRNFTRYANGSYQRNRGSSSGELQETQFGDVQIGNGADETHYVGTGASVEGPYDTSFYLAGEDDLSVTVYASASDTIDFRGQVLNANIRSQFVIHPSSSTSATYLFDGFILRGYKPTLKTGITFEGISFIRNAIIDAKASTVTACGITESVSTTAAMKCSNGAAITNSDFTKSAETYAIELADAGSYDLTGNTYTGYTNALHILATSGTVTITTDNPSVTYVSEGATVVLVAGADLTLDGLVSGSEVRAYSGTPGSATLVASTESSGTSFTFSHSIPTVTGFITIRKADYKFLKIPITYSATDQIIPVSQQPDIVYANP